MITRITTFIILSDPLEVSAQNERLQHDLDQSKIENKNLTKQMQSWKEQLIDIGKFLSNMVC